MYRAVTRDIEVTVEPNFLPGRSSAEQGQYFWSYTIVIINSGHETVQLRTRHWIITDATGRRHERAAKRFFQHRRQLLERLDRDGPVSRLSSWRQLQSDIDLAIKTWQ